MNFVSKVFAFTLMLTLVASELALLTSVYSELNMEQLACLDFANDASDEKETSENSNEDSCDDKITLSGGAFSITPSFLTALEKAAIRSHSSFNSKVATPPPDKA